MRKILAEVLQRLGLKKIKDKFIIVNGVKVRVVAEPYSPPKTPAKPK